MWGRWLKAVSQRMQKCIFFDEYDTQFKCINGIEWLYAILIYLTGVNGNFYLFQFQRTKLLNGPDVETGTSTTIPQKKWLHFISPIFVQALTLTFLAEWGDRSQLTTIVLAAREVSGVCFCIKTAVHIAPHQWASRPQGNYPCWKFDTSVHFMTWISLWVFLYVCSSWAQI